MVAITHNICWRLVTDTQSQYELLFFNIHYFALKHGEEVLTIGNGSSDWTTCFPISTKPSPRFQGNREYYLSPCLSPGLVTYLPEPSSKDDLK
jgi:hypothetical protein